MFHRRIALALVLILTFVFSGVAFAQTPSTPTSTTLYVTPYILDNPQNNGGNVTCEELGYEYSSDRVDYDHGKFESAFPDGISVSVTGGKYVDWTSTFGIGAVIVKGGPAANIYEYAPQAYGDTGLAAPINRGGNRAGLSNLTFCWNKEEFDREWPEGGTATVAYEDLPFDGYGTPVFLNDWDYNDLVLDIDTVGTFLGTPTDYDLIRMNFTVRPQVKTAQFTHMFHLASNTFACNGSWELYLDGVLVNSGMYDDMAGLDVVLFDTGTVIFPPDPNATVALLSISFTGDCNFSFDDWPWNPSLYHGENLFFNPYIYVNDTGEIIGKGDVRMLTIPVDWQWPEPDWTPICDRYPLVTNCVQGAIPPTFVPYWWTVYTPAP